MDAIKKRNFLISAFVLVWLAVFNYESVRYFYLQPAFNIQLPKMKFLFPPAGWIMFFNVDDRAGYAEVYGIKKGVAYPIDPHEIIKTRFIGFDMVHRNVLSTVLEPQVRGPFCAALQNLFPEFEKFTVTVVEYPSLTKSRFERYQAPLYECPFKNE